MQLLLTTVCPGAYPSPGNALVWPAGQTFYAPNWTAADGVTVSGAGGFNTTWGWGVLYCLGTAIQANLCSDLLSACLKPGIRLQQG